MDLQGVAADVAHKYQCGARRLDQQTEHVLSREVGPASAEYIGMLSVAKVTRKFVYGTVLRALVRLDPELLPPDLASPHLTTNQLADAVLDRRLPGR